MLRHKNVIGKILVRCSCISISIFYRLFIMGAENITLGSLQEKLWKITIFFQRITDRINQDTVVNLWAFLNSTTIEPCLSDLQLNSPIHCPHLFYIPIFWWRNRSREVNSKLAFFYPSTGDNPNYGNYLSSLFRNGRSSVLD